MEISENSRIWIYQANREFNAGEQTKIEQSLKEFTAQWNAHGHKLAAKAEIRYNRFIILMVDEEQEAASGCSIDKSVSLIREIETAFNVSLFDRFNIAYRQGEHILSCNREEFEQLIREGKVTEDTIVFNNLVPTVKELNENWEVPFKQSWHARVFA